MGGRIIELPLIPSSPLCWVKRGKKPVEKAARVRPKLSLSLSLSFLSRENGRKKERRYIYIESKEERISERRERKGRIVGLVVPGSRDVDWGKEGGKEDRIEGMITFVSYLTLERAG